jgi:hypothetical protein
MALVAPRLWQIDVLPRGTTAIVLNFLARSPRRVVPGVAESIRWS